MRIWIRLSGLKFLWVLIVLGTILAEANGAELAVKKAKIEPPMNITQISAAVPPLEIQEDVDQAQSKSPVIVHAGPLASLEDAEKLESLIQHEIEETDSVEPSSVQIDLVRVDISNRGEKEKLSGEVFDGAAMSPERRKELLIETATQRVRHVRGFFAILRGSTLTGATTLSLVVGHGFAVYEAFAVGLQAGMMSSALGLANEFNTRWLPTWDLPGMKSLARMTGAKSLEKLADREAILRIPNSALRFRFPMGHVKVGLLTFGYLTMLHIVQVGLGHKDVFWDENVAMGVARIALLGFWAETMWMNFNSRITNQRVDESLSHSQPLSKIQAAFTWSAGGAALLSVLSSVSQVIGSNQSPFATELATSMLITIAATGTGANIIWNLSDYLGKKFPRATRYLAQASSRFVWNPTSNLAQRIGSACGMVFEGDE